MVYDSTVSYTQEQVCYFTAGDCCRVFLLHLMYEGVETAVIIWCCMDIRLDGLCLAMHEVFIIHHNILLYMHIFFFFNRCWNCHCKFHQNLRSFLKNFLVCLKQHIQISVNNYTTLSLFALPKGGANIILHHLAHFLTQFSYAMYIFKCGQLPKLLSSISSCYGKVLWLHSSKFNFWLEGW